MTLPFDDICSIALSLGFDACGVSSVHRLDTDADVMDAWVSAGLHGEMHYLERNCDKRYDPSLLVPGCKTMLVCLLRYSKSGHDYHRRVKSLLYSLEGCLREQYGDDIVSSDYQHVFCDSAPVLERRWCVEAGLGFIGRNRQLIHPTLGSMVHPGELLLNAGVTGAPVGEAGVGCGSCHRCLDACPTGALRNTVWDARLCIAYRTHHCMICQTNCPYNNESHP